LEPQPFESHLDPQLLAFGPEILKKEEKEKKGRVSTHESKRDGVVWGSNLQWQAR